MQVTMKNPTCLQLWVMLLMSNLVHYERLFKDSIEIPQIMPQIMPGIIFLNKMLSEHSRCVAFTLMSMKQVI